MAWTKLTYACGHHGEEQMYGPGRERADPQKAWAEKIRAGAVSVISTATGMLASKPEVLAERGITIEEVSSFAKRIMRQTSAKYFIDIIRGKDARMMAEYLCKRAAEVKAEEIGKALIAGGAK